MSRFLNWGTSDTFTYTKAPIVMKVADNGDKLWSTPKNTELFEKFLGKLVYYDYIQNSPNNPSDNLVFEDAEGKYWKSI
jgi:hypothetical protein